MLGPYKNEGNEMSHSIVASNGHSITCRKVRLFRTSELHSETKKRKRTIFDYIILKKLGELVTILASPNAREDATYFDSVDLASAHLPEDYDHIMPYGTTVFEKPITDQ